MLVGFLGVVHSPGLGPSSENRRTFWVSFPSHSIRHKSPTMFATRQTKQHQFEPTRTRAVFCVCSKLPETRRFSEPCPRMNLSGSRQPLSIMDYSAAPSRPSEVVARSPALPRSAAAAAAAAAKVNGASELDGVSIDDEGPEEEEEDDDPEEDGSKTPIKEVGDGGIHSDPGMFLKRNEFIDPGPPGI